MRSEWPMSLALSFPHFCALVTRRADPEATNSPKVLVSFRDKLPVAVRRVNAVHEPAWSSQTQSLLTGYGVTSGHGFCLMFDSSSFSTAGLPPRALIAGPCSHPVPFTCFF